MDNLTHSLAGAVLGQLGLKKKTGLGMATLIIAANIPDIDAFATLLDGVQHLAIRRGITHGPIAMVVLPLLLTGIMIWFDRWQTKRGKRPAGRLPIHKGWLLALAYIGCLSHPALDWLNSYGVRLLEPFSSQWFYGDSIFIIDIWIWAALIAGVWISRRREKKGRDDWQRPAWVSFTVICAYIFANGLITRDAESRAFTMVENVWEIKPASVVANPIPIQFWEREILWRSAEIDGGGVFYGSGDYSIARGPRLLWTPRGIDYRGPVMLTKRNPSANLKFYSDVSWTKHPYLLKIQKRDKDFEAFLFWSRMPVVRPDKEGGKIMMIVSDQRFMDPLVGDRFTVKTEVPENSLDYWER